MSKLGNGITIGKPIEPVADLHVVLFSRHHTLVINDNLLLKVFEKRPNWWWRMWQWLLLGWRWEDETPHADS